MEAETTEPAGNKKKILIIALVVIVAVAGVAVGYLFVQKDTPPQVVAVPEAGIPSTIPAHIYTDAEKRRALEDFAKNSATGAMSEAEKLSALKSFSAKTQTPLLSDEEKRKALETFASSTQPSQ